MLKKCLVSSILCAAAPAASEIRADYIRPGSSSFSGGLGFSEVEYASDDHTYLSENKTLGIGFSLRLSPSASLLLDIASIFDGKINESWRGWGYEAGGGFNVAMRPNERLDIVGFGFLSYSDAECKYVKDKRLKIGVSEFEAHLGVIGVFKANRNISVYFGPDFVLHSDGEIAFKRPRHESERIERDEILSFKAGAEFKSNELFLRPEISFLGEKSFMFSMGSSI